MEAISSCKIVYVKGADNTMADALSRYPTTEVHSEELAQLNAQHPYITSDKQKLVILNRAQQKTSPLTAIASLSQDIPQKTILCFAINDDTITKIRNGYKTDPWCTKLLTASQGMPELHMKDGLWFLNQRLIIPANDGLRAA